MKKRLKDLDASTAAVKPFLEQYLQEHGIDTSKNFKCLNPKHHDTNASMTIKQDPQHAYCFGCSTILDIFTAAAYLEGKPLKGKLWIEDNLLYLAKKYGVVIDMADMTEDEVYEYRTYKAYRLAARLVSNPEFGDYSAINKEIEKRGWDKTRLAEWGIGTVNYKEFKEVMKDNGFEPNFLTSADLDRSNLFNENNLLFTVYDEFGNPVGFSARNINFNKEDPNSKKYINTKTTGMQCNIFKKGERLYGFDIAKDVSGPLYLFEGQADVTTARHHGIMNCCCTMGTALTDHHISLLKRNGIFNIVLVLDGDNAGEKAVQKIMDEKFAPHKEFRIRLIHLPGGMDPDELIREKGVEEFARLKRWDAFEWRLNQFSEDEDPEEICTKILPIILSEKSHVRHEKMAKVLKVRTGLEFSTIMSEIKRMRSEKDANLAERKTAIIEDALYKTKRNPEESELVLTEAMALVRDVDKKFGNDSMGVSTTLDFVLSQKEIDEKKTGEFAGFYLKPDGLGGIGSKLNDNWRSDHWICIGGQAQSGKSSMCAQLAYEIASDERNNATVIYHSIDDAARFILFKMVANAAEDIRLKLGHISNPNYWMLQPGYDYIRLLRDKGYNRLINLIKDQKIVLKDATENTSLAYAENLLRYYRETHPDRNIVLVIDNFHKLPDYGEKQGSERVKALSNQVKNLTTAYRATLITTVEYKKIYDDSMPKNSDIADSRAIEYDSTCVLHLHNDWHTKGANRAMLVHEHNGEILPRVRVGFGKNKISGYEGREFVDFYPASATMKAVDLNTAEQDQKYRKEFLYSQQQGKAQIV